ncbi:PD40 domain-containing protein, partial [Candidatus Micrarchaeota archaeon]|nr:PD40 domain-containing protein [Candidatus Micrarchaeota archaeon]
MNKKLIAGVLALVALLVLGCVQNPPSTTTTTAKGVTSTSSVVTTTSGNYVPPEENVPVAAGWSTPINLGPPINTLGWEDSAFISPDGKTLYFSYANFDWLTLIISGKRVKTGPDKGLDPTDLCDAMVSQKTDSGWTEPKLLEI